MNEPTKQPAVGYLFEHGEALCDSCARTEDVAEAVRELRKGDWGYVCECTLILDRNGNWRD